MKRMCRLILWGNIAVLEKQIRPCSHKHASAGALETEVEGKRSLGGDYKRKDDAVVGVLLGELSIPRICTSCGRYPKSWKTYRKFLGIFARLKI